MMSGFKLLIEADDLHAICRELRAVADAIEAHEKQGVALTHTNHSRDGATVVMRPLWYGEQTTYIDARELP